ncbi:MAG: Zn-dependent hydrolase [Acidimicrobiales bacterium]
MGPVRRSEVGPLRMDTSRLLGRLFELGAIGGLPGGGCARLALTDADRAGRDLVVSWMHGLGLQVGTDQLGNVIGVRAGLENGPAVMMGSHIDTVATGGLYDGNLGVLAGLEVIEAVAAAGITTRRPLAVALFTNEEGARFAPDMLGSLAFVGGLSTEAAHQVVGIDGARVGDELARIGYLGPLHCPGPAPFAFVELHIEQGPVLEDHGITIGAVTGVQGISWQRLIITGRSGHAGTTPMHLRADPGYVAMRLATFVRDLTAELGPPLVGTVGRLELSPNLVNVIPATATLTVDLRHTDDAVLRHAEGRLAQEIAKVCAEEGVTCAASTLARFEPVDFHPAMIDLIEATATGLGRTTQRMPSGAGHDAQMLARVCPAGMIFVPSVGGISHNITEHTDPDDLAAGAEVLAAVVLHLAQAEDPWAAT